MDTHISAMLAALVVLVLLSAFFSATETAFSTLNRIRLKSKADDGNERAAAALALAEDYDRLLSTILIGNNAVNIAAATIGTVLFTHFFVKNGAAISTVVLTAVILIFAEITPKSLAKDHAEAFACAAAPFVKFFLVLLTPLNALFALWKKLLVLLFRPPAEDGVTEDELITMVSEAEEDGNLERHESQLIRAAIEFNDEEVSEILVPRVDIVASADTASLEELSALFTESGFSRIPIFHDTIDNIIGIVHEKDLYIALSRGETSLSTVLSPAVFTTPTAKISHLLQTLQRQKAHMVIVVDEYGGTEGLATLEDILEELVGEIWDEHDDVIEEFRRQSDSTYLVSGSANLDDFLEKFNLHSDCESSTVSGWVLEHFGRLPVVGDRIIEGNAEIIVTRVQRRRVLEVRVKLLPEDAGAETGT